MIENSKRGDKMWETRNNNTTSSETVENSMSVVEMGETGNINKETVFCDNSRKEKQIIKDCGHEGQKWYENLKKHFLK